jgi:predicted patatin/cPLA2 family phospholipase
LSRLRPGNPTSQDELFGVNPVAVISAIKARTERWCEGHRPSDGRKLGLVIEGGAMRSVYSAGGAVALAHLGFSELFDEVYATSAGVMNASYFLSNQPFVGITVYYDSCTSRLFMNPLRVWKVLDIDYLFDQVVATDKPLDVAKVLSSPSKFFIALVDKSTGEGIVVEKRATETPLLRVLKAATSMPVFYNRTVEVDGRPCMDGGLVIPFPLAQALANGCTDVLVLLTRPTYYRCEPPTWRSRRLFDMICARGNAGVSRAYAHHHETSRAARDLAFGRIATPPGVNIATICTEAPEIIHRTSGNPFALRQAALDYGRKVLRIFGTDDKIWDLPAPSIPCKGRRRFSRALAIDGL